MEGCFKRSEKKMEYLDEHFREDGIPLLDEDCLLGHKGALSLWLTLRV